MGGRICQDVNHYLRWAFVEAGNLVRMSQRKLAGRHVVRLYRKVHRKQCHQKAGVAVGRHLAEAAYWVLKGKKDIGSHSARFRRKDLSSTHR